MCKAHFSFVLIFTVFFSQILCLSKSEWEEISEVCGTQDVILLSENKSESLNILRFLPITVQMISVNSYSKYLAQYKHSNEFRENIVIISNYSLVRQSISRQSYSATRFLFLVDIADKRLAISQEMLENFARTTLADFSDIFYLDKQRLYGLTCVKNVCISMRLKEYQKYQKMYQGVPLKFALVRDWEDLVGVNSSDSLAVFKASQELNLDLLVEIQKLLNFSIEILSTSDWAVQYNNGSWGGMAGLVDSSVADVGLSRTYILPYRVRHFRFLGVVQTERLIAYYHPPTKTYTDIIVDDFDLRIWILLALQALLVIFIMRLVLRLDISQAVIFVIGAISQQGTSHRDSASNNLTQTSRTFSLILNMSGLVFYALFSALLVSTFSIESNVIRGLDDLLKRGYRFGILFDSYLIKEDAISGMPKSSVLGQIMKNVNPEHKVVNLDVASRTILKNEQYAFLSEINLYSLFPNYASNQEIYSGVKDLAIKEEKIKTSAFVMKDSPYAESFNFAYQILLERGNTARFWKLRAQDSMQMKPSCQAASKFTPVDIIALRSAFCIVLIGILISLIVLCLEKLCRNQSQGAPSVIISMPN